MIGDLVLAGVVLVALAFICLLAYGIGYDHGRRDAGKWVVLPPDESRQVCGICGMRYAAPGMTACSTCA